MVISDCCFAAEDNKLHYQELVREEAQDIEDQLGGELKTIREDSESLVREKAEDMKDQLGEELKTFRESLEKAAREESREIKDQLGEMHQSIDSVSSSQTGGG